MARKGGGPIRQVLSGSRGHLLAFVDLATTGALIAVFFMAIPLPYAGADRVYLLAGGVVVDAGSHAELIGRNLAYAALFASLDRGP